MKKKYVLPGVILLMGLALLLATVGQKLSEKRQEEVYQVMNEELMPLRVEKTVLCKAWTGLNLVMGNCCREWEQQKFYLQI